MRRIYAFILVFLLGQAACAPVVRPTTQPFSAIRRVMIVSIDGLRPDLALRADAPTIQALMKAGSFTFWARTTAVSITLPSHVSMLTGVPPEKHRIDWNTDRPLIYPAYPTLFEIAHQYGYTTAMAAGKGKFEVLAKPGTLDWVYVPRESKTTDEEVREHAVQIIKAHQPQVMFVHFPGVDNAGHATGWASPEQMAAIHTADTALGEVIAAAREAKTLDQTLVIVTGDHGGAGLTHGADDPRSRHIPWIVVGPGVRANYDLTRAGNLTINTEDTCATACYVLGLTPPLPVDGKPVLAIFEMPNQLLVDSPKP